MKFTEECACIVVDVDGLIVNRIVCSEDTPEDWTPGPGLTMHKESSPMAIGGTYVNGAYTSPPEPEDESEE